MDMKIFKYQVAVDGYGPAYDATIWKFLSNSVVYMVFPDRVGT